ncbi:MAG: HAD family acid phosphatase [Nocardioides sp.]|uniref:HAD family acid phosphatase n=1 Tax=Nocardioides sp. TaxID=35761 RepID=UPI0039E38988
MVIATIVAATPAQADDPLAPRTHFTMVVNQADGTVAAPTDGADIPNIDSVKSTIRAYYGASKGTDPADPDGAQIYLPNLSSSRYADDVKNVEETIAKALPKKAGDDQAVVFDVDSTLLSDYANEEEMNFNYDSGLNAAWVTGELFPAIPGIADLVSELKSRGYDIYGITGRPASQEDDTIANLTAQGFTDTDGNPIFDNDNLFTKWATTDDKPSYIGECTLSSTCNTVEYKANTRKHIEEDLGDTVAMNVGDQWSDLEGGYAEDWTKIPNPSYFLAAADIAGAPASDKKMVPPTTYVMAADGSSGYDVRSGDDIPNLDPLRKEIRAYYNAPTSGDDAGVADKTSSPYIDQMTSLADTWTPQIVSDCRTEAAALTRAESKVKAATKRLKAARAAVTRAAKAVKRAHSKTDRAKAKKKLASARKRLHDSRRSLSSIKVPATPAAVFDSDDTTLWNYDLEDSVMKFTYNSATAAEWIAEHKFPAVPGMVDLVQQVQAAGCTIVGLTGRPHSQQADTIANLTEDGYVTGAGRPLFTAAHFFTKWEGSEQPPAYLDCGSDRTCSTTEYKAGTRAHLEATGYDVVADVGDQFSDLLGGAADHTYKIPNPTYYLP